MRNCIRRRAKCSIVIVFGLAAALALPGGANAAPAAKKKNATKNLKARNGLGDRIELKKVEPGLPHDFQAGEKLTFTVAYRLQSEARAKVVLTPYHEGRPPLNYQSDGPVRVNRGKGEVELWFTFPVEGEIDEYKICLIGERGPILQMKERAEADWAGGVALQRPKDAGRKVRVVPLDLPDDDDDDGDDDGADERGGNREGGGRGGR